jgi:hypothetical protein
VGETRVDILHLLEDLRDAYPGSLEETVVTEIVANSLDSGAARIAVAPDPSQNALLVTDDGTGMKRRELARFHDIAASGKTPTRSPPDERRRKKPPRSANEGIWAVPALRNYVREVSSGKIVKRRTPRGR